MRINEFSVANVRNIKLAAWSSLPPVMLITGPNGCGKSTLLHQLRNVQGEHDILYVGPHRSSRRQHVRMRYLLQQNINMTSLLSTGKLPGFEGLEIPNRTRDAWNSDEASSYLKFSLCQVELDRQAALTQRFDRDGAISKQQFSGDVWDPLQSLTENLLPHLRFDRIDVSNRDEVKCYFAVHNLAEPIDIDDLSSGEKAIIQLFYPLVEHRVRAKIEALTATAPDPSPVEARKIAVIIDEPELHLHPNLQAKVLDYIRKVSLEGQTQFVLATHSLTMVEQANSSELFLLRPSELVSSDENQIIQVATDDDKLALMRDVFGNTSNITAMRKILVVEGTPARPESKSTADARIYGFLSDRFGQVTLVAGGSKLECKTLVDRLNTILREVSPSLKSVAVVDRDIDEITSDPTTIYLPVSMIENLLIDPKVMWDALAIVRHKLDLTSAQDVERAIDDILDKLEKHEIARRAKATLGPRFFRLKDPIAEAQKQVDEFSNSLRADFSALKIEQAIDEAREKVSKLKSGNRRREHFDGKFILAEFHKLHVNKTGMSREIFIYECARHAGKRQSVNKFVEELFNVVGVISVKTTTERLKEKKAASDHAVGS